MVTGPSVDKSFSVYKESQFRKIMRANETQHGVEENTRAGAVVSVLRLETYGQGKRVVLVIIILSTRGADTCLWVILFFCSRPHICCATRLAFLMSRHRPVSRSVFIKVRIKFHRTCSFVI